MATSTFRYWLGISGAVCVLSHPAAASADPSQEEKELRREMMQMRHDMQQQIDTLKAELDAQRQTSAAGPSGAARQRHRRQEMVSGRPAATSVPVRQANADPHRANEVDVPLARSTPAASARKAIMPLYAHVPGSTDAGVSGTPPDQGFVLTHHQFLEASDKDESVHIGGIRIGFPGGRPTIASDDGRYSFSAGLVFSLDIGGFLGMSPRPGETKGRFPTLTENARRLRLPFTFRYDSWVANLTPDFGGSSDGNAGLYEANLNYAGLHNTVFTVGYFQPRVTLEDAESSNEFEMMERPTITDIVRNISAGDARFSLGGLTYGKGWLASAYLTGQTYGSRTTDTTITDSQTGGVMRLATRPVATKDIDVHLGVSAVSAFKLNQGVNGRSITLGDRPELRLTPETLVSTGRLAGVSTIWSAGPEFAFRYRRFLLKSEYYTIGVNRNQLPGSTPTPNLMFDGYYVALNYTLLGRPRAYNPRAASFRGPAPEHDFDPTEGYWGAVEISGRWSVADLDDGIRTEALSQTKVGGIRGGRQTVWSADVNWYPNRHYRAMLEYNRFIVSRSQGAGTINSVGRDGNSVAVRVQAAF